MEKLTLSSHISAPREKVWNTLWNDDSYRAWTSAFSEGSHVQTDNWKEGSKVLFLDGQDRGMVSMVAANRPHEFMSFRHLGEIMNGVEDTTSDRVKEWAGAHENYTLTDDGGGTLLTVEMDINDEFRGYFEKTWPLALQKLKELAESKE